MARTPTLVQIDAGRCSGCGRCIAACHLPIFTFQTQAWRKTAVVQQGKLCTGCGKCEQRCPVGAIALHAAPTS